MGSMERIQMIAKIASCIEKTNAVNGDMFTFASLLRCQKVFIHLTLAENGQPKGITFEHEGRMISGRQLKRSRLTWQKLTTQENIHYDPETISDLEAEIQKRDEGEYEVVTSYSRRHYFFFVTKTRKYPITFKAKDEDLTAVISLILSLLLALFGIQFTVVIAEPGNYFIDYEFGKPLNIIDYGYEP